MRIPKGEHVWSLVRDYWFVGPYKIEHLPLPYGHGSDHCDDIGLLKLKVL